MARLKPQPPTSFLGQCCNQSLGYGEILRFRVWKMCLHEDLGLIGGTAGPDAVDEDDELAET